MEIEKKSSVGKGEGSKGLPFLIYIYIHFNLLSGISFKSAMLLQHFCFAVCIFVHLKLKIWLGLV